MKKNIAESRMQTSLYIKEQGDSFSDAAEKQEKLCDSKDPDCRCKQNTVFLRKISCVFWTTAGAILEEKEDLLLDVLANFAEKHLTDFPKLKVKQEEDYPEIIYDATN